MSDLNLSKAGDQLAYAVNNLDDVTEGPLADLARRHKQITDILASTKTIRDALELAMAENMEEDTLTAGAYTVVRDRGVGSRWKTGESGERMREDITDAVATKVATDVMTGEVDPMRRNLIRAAMTYVWDALPAPSSVKKSGREQLGIRLSDYRDFYDTTTVKVIER